MMPTGQPAPWPEPTPLEENVLATPPLSAEWVPGLVWRYAEDISERMQAPVEVPVPLSRSPLASSPSLPSPFVYPTLTRPR
jgi:hypothetical protein